MQTITKEELIEMLEKWQSTTLPNQGLVSTHEVWARQMADFIMPEFIPRKGQIVAFWDYDRSASTPGVFMEYDQHHPAPYKSKASHWKHARPLTLEEIT